ncbi:E3 ubiquitin-protein ligase TRIM56-like isoform X1 [Arapaima gigas]
MGLRSSQSGPFHWLSLTAPVPAATTATPSSVAPHLRSPCSSPPALWATFSQALELIDNAGRVAFSERCLTATRLPGCWRVIPRPNETHTKSREASRARAGTCPRGVVKFLFSFSRVVSMLSKTLQDTTHMASQLSDKIKEDFLECKVCFEVYRTPRTLSCLHSFCEPCLEQLLDKEKGTVTCPDCRTVSDLQGSVHNAKASFFINSLLDLFHSKTTKEATCSMCLALGKNGVSALFRCLDCADFLCSSCAQGHCLSRLTLDHSVVSLANYIAGCHDEEARLKQERRCQSHGEPLRFYCDTCTIAICRDCRMLEHFSHQVQSLLQAATARKPQLEQLISSLDGNIQCLTEKEKEVDSARQQLREAQGVVEDQLSGHLSALIEQLFAQKDAVAKELAFSVEQQEQKCLSIKEELHRLAGNTPDGKLVHRRDSTSSTVSIFSNPEGDTCSA